MEGLHRDSPSSHQQALRGATIGIKLRSEVSERFVRRWDVINEISADDRDFVQHIFLEQRNIGHEVRHSKSSTDSPNTD